MLDECHLLWGDLCGYVWAAAFGGLRTPETCLGKTNERIEVDMTNYRNKQTYFGAVDYHTGEFLVKAYPKGNSDHTIEFLQYLQAQSPGQRLVVIWDGASYHRSEQMQQYLEQVNVGKVESDWQLYCLRFAPNAPEQNPVEDIWLQAKTYVRQRYYQCPSFKSLKQLFMQFLDGRVFDFPKLHSYG